MEKGSLNTVTSGITGAAIDVHRALGPGLLESAYQACLAFELAQRKMKVEQQKPVPLIYGDVKLDCGYGIDLLIDATMDTMFSVVTNPPDVKDNPNCRK